LIAKLKMSENDITNDITNDKDEEMSKNVIDEFIIQVDIAQEIINIASMLIQVGHFGYRMFEEKLQGTDNLKEYLKFLRIELDKW